MTFNLDEFKMLVEHIERKHENWFKYQAEINKPASIHNFYYVYFNSQMHLLRFTTNSDLPDTIKDEIKDMFENYQMDSEKYNRS